MPATRVPALGAEGWFTEDRGDGLPALVGNRCTACGTVFFPRASGFCRNPDCDGDTFEDTNLSRTGTIWSYTDARYQPPPPYVPPADPYEPFALAAVELAEEQLVVMGQLTAGVTVDDLRVGMPVELVTESLFIDADGATEHVIWKWRPCR
jgi:uncharacterized OB-fold protein